MQPHRYRAAPQRRPVCMEPTGVQWLHGSISTTVQKHYRNTVATAVHSNHITISAVRLRLISHGSEQSLRGADSADWTEEQAVLIPAKIAWIDPCRFSRNAS